MLTPALRPPDDTRPILTVGSVRHVDGARRVARAGSSSSWRRRCAASASTGTSSVPSPTPSGTPDSTSPPSPCTRRSPAPTTSTPTTSRRGSTCSIPDDEVWVSHLGRRRLRGAASTHGRSAGSASAAAPRSGTATSRPCTSAPRCSTSARCGAGTAAGYRQAAVPCDGWVVVIGAGSAHGVGVLPDGRSPFHFDRRRLALLEPPHMHTSMAFVPAGQIGPARRRRRRRAVAADLDDASTRSDGSEHRSPPDRRAAARRRSRDRGCRRPGRRARPSR